MRDLWFNLGFLELFRSLYFNEGYKRLPQEVAVLVFESEHDHLVVLFDILRNEQVNVDVFSVTWP